MKGLVIGGVGIAHVFLAQFAIGGGMLLWYFERLGQRGQQDARTFVDGYFKVLVLISFVVGALTGVAMWFTSIQVGARTIGLMVDEFHWLWATEWVWFAVEITAGYAFYRCGPALGGPARLRLLALYAIASWMSLFWINGILSWQLTPGRWLDGGGVWAGFFNASFFPSLLFRTAVATILAALVGCIVINTMEIPRERRAALIRRASWFAAPIAVMPVLALWFLAVLPEDSRSWLLGGSMPMTMFLGVAAGVSLLIGGYVIVGLLLQRLYINGATATLLLVLAFGATAAGEFVREGARKPYTVRGVLYSTSIRPEEVAALRASGATAGDPYALQERYPTEQLARGAKVARSLCDACHTMHGANSLVELTRTWTDDQLRLNIAKLQRTKGFMPPFAGNAEDVEALVQLLRWERGEVVAAVSSVAAGAAAGSGSAGSAASASASPASPETLAQIARWLEEAGTAPAGATR
jgi:cytochrome bd ubiquinol oxidase subunit I